MSSVFSRLSCQWLGKLEYLLIAISILSLAASFLGNSAHIFGALTPIFLFLSLHAHISKQKRSNESRQQQERLFQLEQLVLSRDANLADVQASLSEFDKLYFEFSQIQQRFDIIENFLKPYKLDAQSLNLQHLLNGLEANIKRTERQYNQGKNLELQLKLQEQISQVEEQLVHLFQKDKPDTNSVQDEIQLISQQFQDLNFQVVTYSEAQAENQDQQLKFDEKLQKLERQFNNLPFVEFLSRLAQLEELGEQVKSSLTESKRVTKSLQREVESLDQKIQSVAVVDANTQCENGNFSPTSELQESPNRNIEMTQSIAKEVNSLRKQTQAILSSLSARITQLRIEVDNQKRYLEKSSEQINTDNLATWAGEIGDRIPQK